MVSAWYETGSPKTPQKYGRRNMKDGWEMYEEQLTSDVVRSKQEKLKV